MIVNFFINLMLNFVDLILTLTDVLPEFPTEYVSGINTIFSYMDMGVNMVNFFIPLNILAIGIPVLLVILNFEHFYNLIMWVLRKLPIGVD